MKKKALIIAVVGGFLPQFEMNDARLLRERGYEVHYAADFSNPFYALDTDALEREGIRLHAIPIRKSPYILRDNIAAYRKVRQIIRDEGIGLIHCHNPVGGVIGRLAAIGQRPRPYVIYTAHGFHFYSGGSVKNWLIYYPIERLLAHFTDTLITINREDYMRARGFSLRSRGIVVWIRGVGVDDRRFRHRPELYDAVREELSIEGDALHVVSAGEFNHNKNCRTVIEAMYRLSVDSPETARHIRYSIFGEGFCHSQWQSLIDDYGLNDMVRIVGYRNDMERMLQSADVFCFASIREGLGIAAIEALLSGVPLICADNRGTREYAEDGVNAIVVKSGNAEDYAAAVSALCRDREGLAKMAAAAAKSAARFTIGETEKVMRGVYERADRELSKYRSLGDNERLQRA